jgi:hypothetical protein
LTVDRLESETICLLLRNSDVPVAVLAAERIEELEAKLNPKPVAVKEEDDLDFWNSRCDRILEDLRDLPDAADDFVNSVETLISSIQHQIETREFITDKQKTTIENTEHGVSKWMHGKDRY